MLEHLQNTALGLVEIGSNQLLRMDGDVLEHCEKISGCCIAIHLKDIDKTLYCQPGSWGINLSLDKPNKDIDATISGRIMALVNLSAQQDKIATSIKERVEVTGNAQVAQQFQKILSEINIDWEEQIAQITGDVIAVKITRTAHSMQNWLKNSLESLVLNSRDYVQHEVNMTPTEYEFSDFKQQVGTIRDGVERLEAKLNFLMQNTGDKNT